MIEKRIIYCWFGDNPFSEIEQACIDSWHKMCPDYEIIKINEDNFDVDMNEYYIAEAKEVLKCKKLYSVDIKTENMPEEIKKLNYKDNDIHRMYVLEIKQYLINEKNM